MVGYYIYPAAPPWYVDYYGFEVVPTAPPTAAGAGRLDELLGFPISELYYAKDTNIFSAIPSLHCGQTFLALYFAFLARKMRILIGLYFGAVFLGSVYLNHHYFIDSLLGVMYALIVAWITSKIFDLGSSTVILSDKLTKKETT